MHRRAFLIKSLGWTLACLVGHRSLGEALAMGSQPREAAMAVIIDDIGYTWKQVAPFLALGAALTYAVLPRLRHSRDLAHAVHDQGFEILLHQPMEPFNRRLDPGPGALFVGDSAARIDRIVDTNVQAVPFAVGVNNHMGSRFTSRGDDIRSALKAINRHCLFFIDSRTTYHSKAYHTACGMRMASGRRDVFLDTDRKPRVILERLYEVMTQAMVCGKAIAIGHPYPETAAALKTFCSEIRDTPVRLVPVSRLLPPGA